MPKPNFEDDGESDGGSAGCFLLLIIIAMFYVFGNLFK